MKTLKHILLVLIVLLALPVSSVVAAEKFADTIVTDKGAEKKVSIQGESEGSKGPVVEYFDEVIGWGQMQKISLESVKSIRYGNPDKDFAAGMDALEAGACGQAIDSLRLFLKKKGISNIQKNDASYMLAQALAQVGKLDEAIQELAAFSKSATSNRHYPEALFFKAEVEMAAKKPADAEVTLKLLEKECKRFAGSDKWIGKSSMLLADVLFQKGDFAKAAPAFGKIADDLKANAEADPEKLELYTAALYKKGMCLVKDNKTQQAATYFQGLVDGEKGKVRMAGHLGLGQVRLIESKPDEAKMEFLRVYTMASEFVSLQPDAISGAAMAYAQLWKRDKKTYDQGKGRILASEFRKRFPERDQEGVLILGMLN